jgi:peptidylprolyl isomerase
VPRVGEEITVQGRKGRIIRVTERFAYIDFNHPLAGKTLKIEIEVKKVITEDAERIKYLASRWLRLPSETIKVEATGENAYKVILPATILMIRDLEAILSQFLNDIYEMTSARKIELVIEAEFKPREEEKKEEGEKESETKEEEKKEEASQ